MSRSFACGMITAGVLLAAAGAQAGGLLALEYGTPRNGTSQAGATASAYDASTAWYNAAGMARIDRPIILLGLQPAIVDIEFDSDPETTFSGGDGGQAGGVLPGLNSFYVRPLNERFAFGASLLAISGAAADYDEDWVGRYQVTDISLVALALTPSLSFRVNEWFSLGAGVSINYAQLDYKLKLPRLSNLVDSSQVQNRFEELGSTVRASLLAAAQQKAAGFEPPPFFDRLPPKVQDEITSRVRKEAKSAFREVQSEISSRFAQELSDSELAAAFEPGPDAEIELSGSDFAPSFNVSALFEPTPRTRIGIAYFHDVDFKFEGDGKVNQSTPLTDALGLSEADIRMEMPIVKRVNLGVYHLLTDRLAIMGDVGWENWGAFESLPLEGESGKAAAIALDWKDTWNASLGLEYQIRPDWRLQTGVRYDSSPVQSAQQNYAFLPVDQQWRISSGVVYDWSEDLQIGLQYTYANFGKAAVDNVMPFGTLKGDYSSYEAHFIALNFQW
jgi:long-subunit fatty acid transport protein